MTPEELAAIEAIEARLALPGIHLPKTAAELRWLCTIARRLAYELSLNGGPAPVVEDGKDAALATQAAQIADLEGKLGLTPDVVFATERQQFENGE